MACHTAVKWNKHHDHMGMAWIIEYFCSLGRTSTWLISRRDEIIILHAAVIGEQQMVYFISSEGHLVMFARATASRLIYLFPTQSSVEKIGRVCPALTVHHDHMKTICTHSLIQTKN